MKSSKMKKMKRKTRFFLFSFFFFFFSEESDEMEWSKAPRSGQLTYPGNLRVVGGSLLDIHRAATARERERERWLETCCTRINTFSKSKEERNSARSHRSKEQM